MCQLSNLKKVGLRKIWQNEARDFTEWLAEPEGLALLSEAIGINISLIGTEENIGDFNVDILAEEENTGRKIVIENQLESTDHDHLGKIITYASGVGAEIVVWIVKNVRDEHKQAVDWLNEQTGPNINIFAIQIEVWQISGSPLVAPKFHVIAKPNDWVKKVKKATAQSDLSGAGLLKQEFWEKFKEFAQKNKGTFRLRKPHPHHWYDISIGSSKAYISLTVNSQLKRMTCQIYIPDSKELFSILYEQKASIEAELAEKLEWEELPENKASKIMIVTEGSLLDRENWEQCHSWMFDEVVEFRRVFGKYIKLSTD